MDEIILHKVESIERCLIRIDETFLAHPDELETNHDVQDIISLNLQRACQTAIDIAIYLSRKKKLGLPKESKEAFNLLAHANIISHELSENLQKMVGFRNILVHEYSDVDYAIVKNILENKLDNFRDFARIMIKVA